MQGRTLKVQNVRSRREGTTSWALATWTRADHSPTRSPRTMRDRSRQPPDPLLLPLHIPTQAFVVLDRLPVRIGRHSWHVDDLVLERDNHESLPQPQILRSPTYTSGGISMVSTWNRLVPASAGRAARWAALLCGRAWGVESNSERATGGNQHWRTEIATSAWSAQVAARDGTRCDQGGWRKSQVYSWSVLMTWRATSCCVRPRLDLTWSACSSFPVEPRA
jgi:hypothetical protein